MIFYFPSPCFRRPRIDRRAVADKRRTATAGHVSSNVGRCQDSLFLAFSLRPYFLRVGGGVGKGGGCSAARWTLDEKKKTKRIFVVPVSVALDAARGKIPLRYGTDYASPRTTKTCTRVETKHKRHRSFRRLCGNRTVRTVPQNVRPLRRLVLGRRERADQLRRGRRGVSTHPGERPGLRGNCLQHRGRVRHHDGRRERLGGKFWLFFILCPSGGGGLATLGRYMVETYYVVPGSPWYFGYWFSPGIFGDWWELWA